MNRHLKRTFVFLALCAVFVLAPPLSRAAGTGQPIVIGPDDDLRQIVETAEEGAVIKLSGSCTLTDETSSDAPWIINKAVTIQGGELTLRLGGIILGANVTFQDITLSFTSNVRNAIMANGHTLTLEDVTCKTTGKSLNLFCGGLYDAKLGSTKCSAGTVIIRGKTSLEGSVNLSTKEVGNIYAGNLCMGGGTGTVSDTDGLANTCQGDAAIIIKAEQGSKLGSIYAGGAQQRTPEGFSSGKVILTDPEKYTVSGRVDITLNGTSVKQVYGSGAEETHVTYKDTGSGSLASILVDEVSNFTAESGHAALGAGSTLREGAALSALPGAKLDLSNSGNLTAGSFTGGGKLILGEQQTLTITGEVTGETTVAVGGFNFDETASTGSPENGYIYISAPSSQASSFTLVPPSNHSGMEFSRDGSGNWTVENRAADNDTTKISGLYFDPAMTAIKSRDPFWDGLPLFVSYIDKWASLSTMNPQISVNGVLASSNKYTDTDGSGNVSVYENYKCVTDSGTVYLEFVSSEVSAEALAITAFPYGQNGGTSLSDGTYVIKLTIPGEHTESGDPLTASATLKVGGDGVIGEITPGEGAANNTVRIYLAAPGGPVKAGTVMAAVYDEKGRLLSFGEVPFPEKISEEGFSVDVPVALSGGKTVRVFAADERKPLCQSQSVSLS